MQFLLHFYPPGNKNALIVGPQQYSVLDSHNKNTLSLESDNKNTLLLGSNSASYAMNPLSLMLEETYEAGSQSHLLQEKSCEVYGDKLKKCSEAMTQVFVWVAVLSKRFLIRA